MHEPGLHPVEDAAKGTIAQFPSFSEAFGYALRSLPDEDTLMAADHRAHAMITPADVAA